MLVSANIPRLGIKGSEAITKASEVPPIVNKLAIFVLDKFPPPL